MYNILYVTGGENMAPVDKAADGSDSAGSTDKSATPLPSSATGDKTVGGMSGLGKDVSRKQDTPVLDSSGVAESTISSKIEDAQVSSEYHTML